VSEKDKNNFNLANNGNHSNKRAALNVKRIALLRLKDRQTKSFKLSVPRRQTPPAPAKSSN